MFVPQEFLNGSDVVSHFQEMHSKTVMKSMAACHFRHTRLHHRIFYSYSALTFSS